MNNVTDKTQRQLLFFGGLSYLGVIITGVFSEGFVRGGLTVTNDAAQTAQNIADNIGLWNIAALSDIFTIGFDLVVALCLYFLLKPTNPILSLLVAFLRIVSLAVLAVGVLSHYLPVLLSGGGEYLNAFNKEQLDGMGYLSLKVHNLTYHVCLILCCFYNVLLGYIMFKSGLFPKLIGILIFICGVCQFANSGTYFAPKTIQDLVGDWPLKVALIAELALTLWMIYKGVMRGAKL